MNKKTCIIILNSRNEWEELFKNMNRSKTKIYSLSDPNFYPFKLNPLKIPYGFDIESHLSILIDVFCRSYGLGVQSIIILYDTIKTLYEKEGIFDTTDSKEISEKSSRITLATVFKYLNLRKKNKEFQKDKLNDVDKILDRLSRYAWENGILYKLYCQPDGMSVDELLGINDVVALERGRIQSNNFAFIFGFIGEYINLLY